MDFAAGYASNKQGIGISIENYLHLKQETIPGTFVPPSVGTQGKSTSAATPSTDITGGTDKTFKIAVDGGAVISVDLTLIGTNTGIALAADIESKVNTALSAAGQDGRVWARFAAGVYDIFSQKAGPTSSVVITNGASNNVADDLKIGVGNGGTEAVGAAGGDFLFMTKASMKVNQPKEPSLHKTGRQSTSTIKKKIVSEGDIEMYVNMDPGGSPALDTPLALLLEAVLGKKTATAGPGIRFDSSQAPNLYFSIVQGNNAFGRQFNGGYPKMFTLSLPGDGEAKIAIPIKARDGHYSSIAQLSGPIVASAAAIVNSLESTRFEVGSLVMVVDPDGRTILAGQDGLLSVLSRIDGSDTVTLSAAVSVADNGFLVPFLPHVLDQHGTDNPVTGLQGRVSFDAGATQIEEIRSVEFKFDHKIEDQDNWYGFKTNMGGVIGDKAEISLKVDMLMSASQLSKIVQSKEFTTFAIEILLGPSGGRHLKLVCPKVEFEVPDTEIPEKGTVVASFNGRCLQTASGALDAFYIEYL